MPRILLTGAGGGIGSRLRKLLPPIYPDLVLSDLKAPADLAPSEKFIALPSTTSPSAQTFMPIVRPAAHW